MIFKSIEVNGCVDDCNCNCRNANGLMVVRMIATIVMIMRKMIAKSNNNQYDSDVIYIVYRNNYVNSSGDNSSDDSGDNDKVYIL